MENFPYCSDQPIDRLNGQLYTILKVLRMKNFPYCSDQPTSRFNDQL